MIFDKRYFVAFFSLHSIRCFSHTIVTNVAYAQYNIVKKLTEEKLSQMSIRKNRWAKLDQKKKIDEHKQIGRKTWDEQNRDECFFDIRWADFQADGQLQLLCPYWKYWNSRLFLPPKIHVVIFGNLIQT